uniref:Uncharacterized protein n=1 Tax=Arundo donax TaxID=35708 RepID=A0A0A9E7Q9_ARUDO
MLTLYFGVGRFMPSFVYTRTLFLDKFNFETLNKEFAVGITLT